MIADGKKLTYLHFLGSVIYLDLDIYRNHFSLTGHFVSFNFGTDRPGHCTQMETNRTGRGQSVPHPDTVLHTRAHAPRGTFSFLTHNSGLVHFVGWAGAS